MNKKILSHPPDLGNVIHFQADDAIIHELGIVDAVVSVEPGFPIHQPKRRSKRYGRTAAVATKALGTVAIEVLKVKIELIAGLDEHEPVGPYAKTTVADRLDLIRIESKLPRPVIDNNKVVSCCLVFNERDFHGEAISPLRSRCTLHP